MPRSVLLTIQLIISVAFLLWTGCAQMFNANLNDMALETAPPAEITPEVKPDLSELKIDPLVFHVTKEDNTASIVEPEYSSEIESGSDKKPLSQITGPLEFGGQPTGAPPVSPTEEVFHLDDPVKKPIILRAQQIPDDASGTPEQIPAPKSDLLSAQPVPGGEFAATQTVPAEEVVAEQPCVVATGCSESERAGKACLDQSDCEKCNLTEFVSSQMENLVPPFAHHPPSDGCVDKLCLDGQPETATIFDPAVDDFDPQVDSIPGAQNDLHVTTTEFVPLESDATEPDHENMFVEKLISDAAYSTASNEVTLPAGFSSPASTSNINSSASEVTLTWQNQLDRTIEAFESEISASSENSVTRDLETGLSILRALKTGYANQLDGEHHNPRQLKKFWIHQIDAINDLLKYSSTSADVNSSASTALQHLHRAVHELQAIAKLKLSFAAFCNKITGYGQYTPFASTEFLADQKVLVYCEIENFAPLLETRDGVTNYQTQLSSSFWIKDVDGQIIQQHDFPVVTDNARNLRRDFFMHLPVTFAQLKPGSYQLQVKVRDHGSGKSAELDQALKFTIR